MIRLLLPLAIVSAAASAVSSYSRQDAGFPTHASDDAIGVAVATPVFAERIARVNRPRNVVKGWWKNVENEPVSGVVFGTAFALQAGDRVLLVTAAHVVKQVMPITEVIADDGTKYSTADQGTTIDPDLSLTRIRVGGIAATPKRVLVDEERDVALLEMDPQDLGALGIKTLKAGRAILEEEVKFWGFPAVRRNTGPGTQGLLAPSATQTSQRADITTVGSGEVVFAPINGVETRGGFSGGPVLNRDKEVIGMIMRSTSENTRCCSVHSILDLAKSFDTRSVPGS